jgi:hypothetical protein
MNRFENIFTSVGEKISNLPIIRSFAKKTLIGSESDERYLKGWSKKGTFAPDAVAGYTQRAVSAEDQTKQLKDLRGGKTQGQIEVEEEEQELAKEGGKGKRNALIAVGLVAGGMIACLFTPIGSVPGQLIGDITRARIEITSGEKAHLGERKVYNSLSFGPSALLNENGGTTAVFNEKDFFQNPSFAGSDEAKDYDAELLGTKEAFRLLINQDTDGLTRKFNDQILTDPSGVADYLNFAKNNNSPKSIDTLISYFKSKEMNDKKDKLYWELLKSKIETLIK